MMLDKLQISFKKAIVERKENGKAISLDFLMHFPLCKKALI